MGSRAQKTNEQLSNACRDFVCAVNENPQAFKNVRFNAPRNRPPTVQNNGLRNVGFISLTALWLSKLYLIIVGH